VRLHGIVNASASKPPSPIAAKQTIIARCYARSYLVAHDEVTRYLVYSVLKLAKVAVRDDKYLAAGRDRELLQELLDLSARTRATSRDGVDANAKPALELLLPILHHEREREREREREMAVLGAVGQ